MLRSIPLATGYMGSGIPYSEPSSPSTSARRARNPSITTTVSALRTADSSPVTMSTDTPLSPRDRAVSDIGVTGSSHRNALRITQGQEYSSSMTMRCDPQATASDTASNSDCGPVRTFPSACLPASVMT